MKTTNKYATPFKNMNQTQNKQTTENKLLKQTGFFLIATYKHLQASVFLVHFDNLRAKCTTETLPKR